MPDRRRHRGAHPEDAALFASDAVPVLRRATEDLCWLLGRGYPVAAARKLVGDRFALTQRQRLAAQRCACSDTQRVARAGKHIDPRGLAGATVWVDGFNVLTTVEAALGGGVLLIGRDGALRDMASMHGSYRKVAETLPAARALLSTLRARGVATCRVLLDAPVSNSARLAALLRDLDPGGAPALTVDIVADPDRELLDAGAGIVVASADARVLDGADRLWHLARETVEALPQPVWVVDLH